jgi:hypothetical protein
MSHWPREINIMGQEISREEAPQQKPSTSQLNQLDPSESTQQILARFPQKHSCQHCKEDVINAFNVESYHPATFLSDKDGAIEAAKNGCELYEWLLLFFFRSQAPPNHGFYLQTTSLKDPHDISSVQFLIGTRMYTWPCAEFEVFTEQGKLPKSWIRMKTKSSRKFCSVLYKYETIQYGCILIRQFQRCKELA